METSCVIAPMTGSDLTEVAALEQLCFSTPWSAASLAAELDKPDAVFLTARQGGRLCGYVGMNTVLDEGYLANLAVHPDCRKQGVGRQLLLAVLAAAECRKLAFVTLEVRPSNAAAIGLYASLGFFQQGRRKAFYNHPIEDGLIMTTFLKGKDS
ncbi:MAG: ribosomal protein S18-alanine N-acetyltransferase [Angelakisella sp.]